ncbi:MAG: aminoglycoside phosphotransferase family protein [Armatimonadota bacterium]|nr:aminoglycoside phosphotransferase family protein [Armatimonadota bacterium]
MKTEPIPNSQLHTWLLSAFPGAQHLSILERIEQPSFQQHLERVTVELAYPGEEPTLMPVFLRVYTGYLSWWTLATPDLPQREWTAWRVATRAGLPIPRTFFTNQDEPPLAIQAVALGDDLWNHLNAVVITDFAQLLVRMHRAPLEDDDKLHLPDVTLPPLMKRFARWAAESEDSAGAGMVRALTARLESFGERPAAFIHGDSHFGNYLSDGQAITAILDWEEAAQGDPRLELAVVDTCLRRQVSVELADLFLRSYEETAGWKIGSLDPWREVLQLRHRLTCGWVKYRIEHGLPLPPTDPSAWIEYFYRVSFNLIPTPSLKKGEGPK